MTQDTALPNGYTEDPRKFTKLLRPPIYLLRKVEKIITADYFDDLISMSYTYDTYPNNIGNPSNIKNNIKNENLVRFLWFSPQNVSEDRIFRFSPRFSMIISLTDTKKRDLFWTLSLRFGKIQSYHKTC